MHCAGCGRENPDDARFCMGCGAQLARSCGACNADLPVGANFCPRCGHPASGVAPAVAPAGPPAGPPSFASGRYTVVRPLGEGASKRVYLARDTLLDREVAIGAIKTEGLDESGIARVQQEARAMGRLGDHQHIVSIYDVSQEGSQLFIVAQYMPGGDLQQLLGRAPGHRLELDRAFGIGQDVCEALAHAHEHGVVHRDVKPGNVWLDAEGGARLGDFGLARAADRTRITQQGMMVGTAAYMAPEQAMGGSATDRSDLYALGATLYEMLAGRPPFVGDDAVAVISQHINTPPVKPSWHNPAVPAAVDALVLRLLAKDPEERPRQADDVAAELARLRAAGAEAEAQDPAADIETALQPGDPYIGRQREQQQLRSALDAVLSGEGRTLMVVGEPGIGKTRLTTEFATWARLRGAQVLVGHCYEGGVAVPYLPFVEGFRHYLRTRPDDALRQELGSGAPEVATLVSEVRRRLPDLPEPAPLEGEAERIRLFESIASFLRSAAASQPLVLVLDDLHWADKPTLLLLQHLARGIRGERVLLVGTYRDVELERTHPLSEVVAALRREQLYERVLLRGLSVEDVRDLMRARSGQDPAEGFVELLYRETEGNPFFLDEVLRHLIEIGALRREGGRWVGDPSVIEQSIPEGVREVIGRRLSLLDERTNELLTIGAAMPEGFTFQLLRRVSGLDEDVVLDALDAALRARLVRERKDVREGAYEFSHALIRQTLYGELSTPRRVRLHRQIAEALEVLHASSLEPVLGALAHHFFQALQAGEADKAVDYSRRAGNRASELLAHEEAAGHFDRALQALDFGGGATDEERCELLLTLAEARYRAGDGDGSRAAFREAAALAKQLDLGESLARAALGFAGPQGTVGELDPERMELLTAAREAMGSGDSALRARLLGRAAEEYAYTPEWEKARPLGEEAVAVARRLGDPSTLSRALGHYRVAIGSPDDPEEQLAVSEESLSRAIEAGDRDAQLECYGIYLGDLRGREDFESVRRGLAEHARIAEELRQPYHRWWARLYSVGQAMQRGHFEEAERLAGEALQLGLSVEPGNAVQFYAAQRYIIRLSTGGTGEVSGAIGDAARDFSGMPGWRAVLASALAEFGRLEEARREFDFFASRDFEPLPRDSIWLACMGSLSGACVELADREAAARLYDLLTPYEERTTGSMLGGAYPVDESLGNLAALLRRFDAAERHYDRAMQWSERTGVRPPLCRNLIYAARMRLDRAEAGDAEAAVELLNRALPLAREMEMKRYLEEALALKMGAQGIDTSDTSRSIYRVASQVQSRRPDLAPHAAADGTVTLMFSDLADFTAMTERLGDAEMHRLMQQHHRIVRDTTLRHGGHEVELRGDGFLLAFATAEQALGCAVAMQRAFATHTSQHPDEPFHVRMGLHVGEVIQDGDGFFGKTVIQAFRIADLADGGEILVSSQLQAALADASDLRFDPPRRETLKGISGQHELFPVRWE